MIVGGTRAARWPFAIFLFIGIIRGWIGLWMRWWRRGVLGIVGMFWLALSRRYGLNVSGDEAFYTFLYLTRDTFSPWGESGAAVAKLPQYRFSGLALSCVVSTSLFPRLWPGRPSIVLNSAVLHGKS